MVAVDIDGEALNKQYAGDDMVLAVQADVTDPAATAAYVEAAVSRWGQLDGLFSNAGWEGALAHIVDYPIEAFDRLMNLNSGRSSWVSSSPFPL